MYLPLLRAKHWIANVSITWEVTLLFGSVSRKLVVDELIMELQKWTRNDVSLVTRGAGRLVVAVNSRRLVLDISEYEFPDGPMFGEEPRIGLSVHLAPVTVGYRHSRVMLEKQLCPLLERLREYIAGAGGTFSLIVHFDRLNPFYGFYAKQLPMGAVREFTLEFAASSHDGKGYVRVGKDRIAVVTTSLEEMRRAAASALAYQLPEAV
jgi:hypothetical protein